MSTSGDLELIRDAEASLDQALAELAALLRPGPGALPVQIDAAKAALEAAQLKLGQLSEPNPADVDAARLEVARAEADLRRLRAGPTQASLAATRQAVAAARARLAQVLAKPSAADVLAARLDVRRAEADLAVLRARGGPAGPLDVALARLKVESAHGRLETAQAAQRLQTVRAPVSGTVTQLLTVRGAPVDTVTPLMTVVDLDRLAVSGWQVLPGQGSVRGAQRNRHRWHRRVPRRGGNHAGSCLEAWHERQRQDHHRGAPERGQGSARSGDT